MPVNSLIQIRRGGSGLWASTNNGLGPVLSAGEFGYETDTGRIKIGDGSTIWNNLPYSFLTYDDLVSGNGITLTQLTNSSGQVTGISIAGASTTTVAGGTGIHVTSVGSTYTVNVSGLTSSNIGDFNDAVDARVTAASISSEQVLDIVSSGIVGTSGIDAWYDDNGTGYLYLSVTGLKLSNIGDVTSSATEVNYLDGTILGTVVGSKALAVDSNKDISGFRDVGIDRNLTVGGNLIVNGTTTTVNSTTVDIGDNIIQVNVSGAEVLGGLQVLDHDNSRTHQIVWGINDSRWEFISNSGSIPNIYTSGGVSANTLTSTVANGTSPLNVTSTTLVTNLNADLLDGQHGSYYSNFNNLTNIPSPVITGELTGDVTGSASVTLNSLGNGVLNISTTIASNSVALGTDTTGQYATTIGVAGTGLSATAPSVSDGTAYTITSNATPSNTTGTIVARDSSGNFSAGTISATFSGNGSSITNINADNISAGTLDAARLPTINVTKLSASGVTIGSTVVNLGQTATGFSGLTALSGVSAGSPLVIAYAYIDGGSP
jgi:hypothetical protein